jgi:hypothetical protein
VILVAAALQAAGAAPQQTGRYQAAAREYQEANSVGKLQFLQGLFARSESAVSVSLDRAEQERIGKRHQAILYRAAKGSELTNSALMQLLAEADEHEQHAIKKLQRDFAFSSAQAFHDNRFEFDRWHDAWDRIEKRYEQDGRPIAWQSRMIDWLALASARQAQISVARLHADRSAKRQPLPASRSPETRIQLRELESRIAGYNLAVSRLFSDLHRGRTWTVEELARAAGELTELATTRHDLQLYWKLLPEDYQAQIVPLRTLDDVIPLLARRTAQRRRDLETAAGDSPRTAWELRRLDEVSRRLATLATPRG